MGNNYDPEVPMHSTVRGAQEAAQQRGGVRPTGPYEAPYPRTVGGKELDCEGRPLEKCIEHNEWNERNKEALNRDREQQYERLRKRLEMMVPVAPPGLTDPTPGIGGAPTRATTIPTEPTARKQHPVASGVLDYFPDALVALANVSWKGNEQHNPGQPLHWARGKSGDEGDALIRHFLQRGLIDTDGIRHSAKMAWRALALLQKELEEAAK